MQIWFDVNTHTHNFISESYWEDNFDSVKNILPQAEIYVYEADSAAFARLRISCIASMVS